GRRRPRAPGTAAPGASSASSRAATSTRRSSQRFSPARRRNIRPLEGLVAARAMRENPPMAPALGTALSRQLGIEYPILSAGIGQAAGPELVSAVSNAGGS